MRKTEKFSLNQLIRSVFIVALAAGAMVSPGIDTARAAPPPKAGSCPLMITACGCVITHSDTYIAANNLTATQTNQNCVEIAASNSILNLKGVDVVGKNDGTGIGILIRKGADHVIVEGGDKTGAQALVTKWKIGIEDDGDAAVIAFFSQVGGFPELLPPIPGNTRGGVLLNGVKDSVVGVLNANANGKFGVMLSNTTDVTLFNFSADKNKETGIRLDSSRGSSIGPGGAQSNVKYGIWLLSSSDNTIRDSNGNTMNGDTGILLGGGSNRNRISSGGAPKNGKSGIVITRGSTSNTVTVTHNQNNGNPNSDMIDLNPNCGNNIWYNNVGSFSQACIQ
jgi:Periplasmic copper-binding protein (NosD)